MKPTNHSHGVSRGKKRLYEEGTSSRAETMVFGTLAVAGLIAVLIAFVSGSVPAGSKEGALAAWGRLPVVRYFSSGQMTADLRTAAAVAHYFFEAEPAPAVTNLIQPGPTQKNLAMPTNRSAVEPKA